MKTLTILALCTLILCLTWLSSPSKVASAISGLSRASAAATPGPTGAKICGVVSAYTPATGAAAGSVRIGGLNFAIAPGTSLSGIVVGQDSCSTFCMDAQGRIAGLSGTAAGQGMAQVCGIVTNFSAPVGGVQGSITIGGATIRLAEGTFFDRQGQVSPGSNTCLIPVGAGDVASAGSFFIQNTSPKQVHIPAIVRGTTFDGQEETFYLPNPTILTLDSDQANVFTVGPATFGKVLSSDSPKVEGFSYSTPFSTVRALSCDESFWDSAFEIAGRDTTEGDMVTFSLLNHDKVVVQQLAMFTIQGGGALLTQLHPDVTLNANLMPTRGAGYFAPFLVSAGNSGMRTLPLALALNPSSKSLNGCFQLAVDIKRAGGVGATTVVIENLVVKRMELPSDRSLSIGLGLINGGMGWFPTGRVCDFICWACPLMPPPPPCGSISGFVYCDGNDNGIKDAGEVGISDVEITLVELNKTTKTLSDGSYRFDNVCAGTYTLRETQPTKSPVTGDGKDAAGSCNGTVGNDVISNIVVPAGASCINYNFGERCDTPPPVKCDTICWHMTPFFITNIQHLPGGTVLIYGVNANNPVGTVQNTNAIRQALNGGSAASQRFNKEYVTGQLSLLYAGGGGSPVVFNTFWSQLTCSGIAFGPVTLSNGVTLSSSSLLDTLVTQSNLAIRENRTQDMGALADIWMLLNNNGRCPQ